LEQALTADGLKWIAECVPPNVEVFILTRWEANDLAVGASDTAAYWLARERGWSFRVLHELHAKCCLVDDDTLFIGSANITSRGLCLIPGGNRELGLYTRASDEDRRTVRSLFRCGISVDDKVVRTIDAWIETIGVPTRQAAPKWPSDIENFFSDQLAGVWVADLPWASADQVIRHLRGERLAETELLDVRHDLAVFSGGSEFQLREGFRNSNCFCWLLKVLSENSNEAFAYFGRLTERLHSSLLDDPRPYRKDVKGLLSNLISYILAFATDHVSYDRPNYSERLTLKKRGRP
jgi:hypothetical protein